MSKWLTAQKMEKNYFDSGKQSQWMIPFSLKYWVNFMEIPTLKRTALEVGCGLNGIWRYDISIIGLDPIDFSEFGTNFVQGNSEDLRFNDFEFDHGYCVNALDHMLNPEKAMSELSRVSKELIIIWSNVWPSWIKRVLSVLDPMHMHHFTETELINLVPRNFKIIKQKKILFSKSHMQYSKGIPWLKLAVAEVLGVHGVLLHLSRVVELSD